MESLEKSIILISAIEALHRRKSKVAAYEKKHGEVAETKEAKEDFEKIQRLVDAFGRFVSTKFNLETK